MNNGALGAGHLMETEIVPLGDTALVVKLGEAIHPAVNQKVRQLADYLEKIRSGGWWSTFPPLLR